VRIPYQDGQLISLFHDEGQVEVTEPERTSIIIRGQIPGRLVTRFRPYELNRKQSASD